MAKCMVDVAASGRQVGAVEFAACAGLLQLGLQVMAGETTGQVEAGMLVTAGRRPGGLQVRVNRQAWCITLLQAHVPQLGRVAKLACITTLRAVGADACDVACPAKCSTSPGWTRRPAADTPGC